MLVAALAVIMSVSLCPPVGAQPLDEARRDVRRLEQNLQDAVERYNYACFKLEQTRGLIEENKAELARAEKELAANKKRLNSRIRAIYVSRQNQFLDVVVNAGDFDEFLVGLDLATKVGRKDAQLVRKVKDARENLLAAKEALKQREAEQVEAREEMAATKAAVERDLSGARGRLAGIEEQIRQAMAARANEAATSTVSYPARNSSPTVNPVARRTRPPGAPHGGVVGVAYAQIGKPYVWGASGPNSFDCSGLTAYCYRVGAGINITHSSYGQASCGTPVSVSELQPGDIVGFRGWGHVGIYVGDGMYIHAPHSGAVVTLASLSARRNYCGAVRP